MYQNKCTKCGKEFETRNPKRVICPDCLYPERGQEGSEQGQPERQDSGSFGGGYNREGSSYGNREGGGGFNRGGGSSYGNREGGGFNRGGGGGFNRGGGGFNRGGQRRPAPKQLLISRDQVAQIEAFYKTMLPLPNPDAHEVIGEKIGLEPQKVFFGINLVRQKMMLPKLPFPKRKLAVSPDQLMAIQNLYSPLLPLPPIGCHKILAQQLKMDEWRVHVGIGIVRKQMNLPRWNSERDDAPEEFKNPPAEKATVEVKEEKEKKTTKKTSTKSKKETEAVEEVAETKEKKTTKTTKKASAKKEAETTETVEEAPKKRGRAKKDTQAE